MNKSTTQLAPLKFRPLSASLTLNGSNVSTPSLPETTYSSAFNHPPIPRRQTHSLTKHPPSLKHPPFSQYSPLNQSPPELLEDLQQIKSLIAKLFYNHEEIESKLISQSSAIAHQEETIHNTNLKLLEQDNKFTHLLMSFNNFIEINEKATITLNELQTQYNVCPKKNDYNNLRSGCMSMLNTLEDKLNEKEMNIQNQISKIETNMKIIEMTRIENVEKKINELEMNLLSLVTNNESIKLMNGTIEKYEKEMKTLRNVIERGLTKLNDKLDKDGKAYEESFRNINITMKAHKESFERRIENINVKGYNKSNINDNNLKIQIDGFKKTIDQLKTELTNEINDIKQKNKESSLNGTTIYDSLKKEFQTSSEQLKKEIESNLLQICSPQCMNKNFEKLFESKKEVFDASLKEAKVNFTEKVMLMKNELSKEFEERFKTMIKNSSGECVTKFQEEINQMKELIHKVQDDEMEIKNEQQEQKMQSQTKGENGMLKESVVQQMIKESENKMILKCEEAVKKIKEDFECLVVKIGVGI